MNADRISFRLVSAFILILVLVTACGTDVTPTPFRPPTETNPRIPPPTSFASGSPFTGNIPTPTLLAFQPTATPPCVNDLAFLSDLTYPDGTVVLPGASVDKQWLVQNSGSCDWDARYTLKFLGGDLLGAQEQIPLYPARVGARVTLGIQFTAASDPGTYESQWQAMGPDGTAFGDAIYVLITVAAY
jgi:hypothetical protein